MQQGTAGDVRGHALGPVLDERLDGLIQGDGVRLPDFPGLHGALPQGHTMLAVLGSTCMQPCRHSQHSKACSADDHSAKTMPCKKMEGTVFSEIPRAMTVSTTMREDLRATSNLQFMLCILGML